MDINSIISFAVSGKADDMGRETWPSNYDDRELSLNLYSQAGANESTRLDIKCELINNTRYTYYHYLRLHNVAERPKQGDKKPIGRSKSFFGLSIRFKECYCRDIVGIYHLLDYIFNEFIEGTVLKKVHHESNEYLVYQIRELAEADVIFKKAENAIMTELRQFENDIEELPRGYRSNGTGQIMQYNLNESGSKAFFDSLFHDSEIYVSEEYLTLTEFAQLQKKEAERLGKKLQQKEDLLEKQETVHKEELERGKKERSSLEISLKNKEDEIVKLKEQVEKLNRLTISLKDNKVKVEGSEEVISALVKSVENETRFLKEALQQLNLLSDEQGRLQEQINVICDKFPLIDTSGSSPEEKNSFKKFLSNTIQQKDFKKCFPVITCIATIVLLFSVLKPSPSNQEENEIEETQVISDTTAVSTDVNPTIPDPTKDPLIAEVKEETALVTWIDLDGDGLKSVKDTTTKKPVGYTIKPGTYDFMILTGDSEHRQEALGVGVLECDNADVTITQNEATGTIEIPNTIESNATLKLTYKYRLQGLEKKKERRLTFIK